MNLAFPFKDWNWIEIWSWSRSFFVFLCSLIALSFIRGTLWKRLKIWTEHSSRTWKCELLAAVQTPMRLAVFGFSLILGLYTVPADYSPRIALTYGTKILIISLSIWIFDRLVVILVRHQNVYPKLSLSGKSLIITIFRTTLFCLGTLVLLQSLGIAITPILAPLGLSSIAIAWALQETLSNIFSGIYLLVDQPIRIGDFVKIEEGVEGHVKKIGWRSTHIQLLSNNTIIIPNTKLASSRVNNYDFPDSETAVLVDLMVSFNNDLNQIERITVEVAEEIMKSVTGAIPHFKPFIRYNAFSESQIRFTVILRARHFTDNFLIKHEFIKKIHARFRKEGIELGYPQRVIHFRKSATPSINVAYPVTERSVISKVPINVPGSNPIGEG